MTVLSTWPRSSVMTPDPYLNVPGLNVVDRASDEVASKSGSGRPAVIETQVPLSSRGVSEWLECELRKRLRALGPLAPPVYERVRRLAESRYQEFRESEGPIFPAILRTLCLDYRCSAAEILHIPRDGPVIVVANHPYRDWEVPLLGAILSGTREDFRFLVAAEAAFSSPVREFLIPIVRPSDRRPADSNHGSVRAAVRWLRSGGVVVVFPAGKMATRPFPTFKLTEQPWHDIATLLARWSDATIVPAFIHGSNHWFFYAAALVYPELRHIVWIWQELRRTQRIIPVSIGSPIQLQPMIEESGLKQATAYLRLRTLSLKGSCTTIVPGRVPRFGSARKL